MKIWFSIRMLFLYIGFYKTVSIPIFCTCIPHFS